MGGQRTPDRYDARASGRIHPASEVSRGEAGASKGDPGRGQEGLARTHAEPSTRMRRGGGADGSQGTAVVDAQRADGRVSKVDNRAHVART